MAVWIKDKKGSGGVDVNDFNNLQTSVTGLQNNLNTLQTNFNTLNGNALVKNSNNQVAQSLQITKQPSEANDVTRKSDFQWTVIVDHGSQLGANSTGEWAMRRLSLSPDTPYDVIVKIVKPGVDLFFSFKVMLGSDINWHYNGPTYIANDGENDLSSANLYKFWFNQNKFKCRSNQAIPQIKVWMRKVLQ